jgi:hypothetical protein
MDSVMSFSEETGVRTGLSLKRWERKDLVQSLRRQGLSYREILSEVPFTLARSTISSWCKEIELTPKQLDRLDGLYRDGSYRGRLLGSKTTQHRRAEEVKHIKAAARVEVSQLMQHELWLAGLMLYWAEGDKTQKVGVANSDAQLVSLMMKWFRIYCGIAQERFRAHLHLHSGQNEQVIKRYWAGVTGLTLRQFGKSVVKSEGTGYRKNMLYRGTIKVQVADRNLLHRIHGWLEGCVAVLEGR